MVEMQDDNLNVADIAETFRNCVKSETMHKIKCKSSLNDDELWKIRDRLNDDLLVYLFDGFIEFRKDNK
jgi:hypothetical protein